MVVARNTTDLALNLNTNCKNDSLNDLNPLVLAV